MSLNKKEGLDWIVKSVNTPAIKSEMVPYMDYAKEKGLPTNEVQEFCKAKGLSVNDFYFLKEHAFSPFCYWKEGVFQGFAFLHSGFLSGGAVFDALADRIKKTEALLKEENFDEVLLITETIGQHLVFDYIYHRIPAEQRYQLFMDIYVQQDYGFNMFSQEIVMDAITNQPEAIREKALKHLRKKVGTFGTITVFRGMGDESTPVEKAMSWTISEKTAYFFANRLGKKGRVVQGVVDVEHIIDYITHRSEEELIILPGNVVLTEEEQMVSSDEELRSLQDSGILSEFQTMRDYFIKPDYYLSPFGVHGVLHVKRVLLHCVSLANAIGLSDSERGVLMLSACYHDIGREHDGTCHEHGKWSLEKMNELDLDTFYVLNDGNGGVYPEYLTHEETEAFEFIVHYHCKSDEEAEKAMGTIEDAEVKGLVQKLLPIFKDADALDRVRISDLNLKFLRTKEARQRVKFAEEVLMFLT